MLEVFFYRDQRFNKIFLIKPQDVDAVRRWTVNVGSYNILMGIGAVVGVVLVNIGQVDAGGAIVWFVCIAHFILGMASRSLSLNHDSGRARSAKAAYHCSP